MQSREEMTSSDPRTASEAVVDAIAAHLDVDPAALDHSLYDVIDPDALDHLVDWSQDKTCARADGVTVTFEYCGHTVVVDGSRQVTIQ
ncbi:MAG: HalOD1 output domain-containing protein [Haloplanus sp.]